jgi:subtilisin family serine protease
VRGRRRLHRRLALVAAFALVLPLLPASGATAASAPPPAAASSASPGAGTPDSSAPLCEGAPGRVLVRFGPHASGADKAAARGAVHGKAVHAFGLVPGLELLSTSLPVGRAVGRLRSMQSVAYAQRDCVRRLDQVPNDELFDTYQWYLQNTDHNGGLANDNIDAAAGWDIRTDASSITVAIIDSGMQLDHVDLAANLWTNPGEIPANGIDDDLNGKIDDVHGWDFANGDNNPDDDAGHGTHVAGLIGARGNNTIGVAGVAWTAKLMPLKVFDQNGNGFDSAIIDALGYAAANSARITNNSYGGPDFDPALFNAFVLAGDAGMLQVVAAGNSGDDVDTVGAYPAAFELDSMISVAATTSNDSLADFSNFGRTTIDLGAPGQDIVSTWPGGLFAQLSGTSMATPLVSGVAALVAAQNPSWTNTKLRNWVVGTTRPDTALAGKTVTGGVVDLGRALGTPAITAKITLDAASDTGSSTSDRITNAAILGFRIAFPRYVTGFTASDLTRSGTATGCVLGPLTGGGMSYHVNVTGCSGGTVTLTLHASAIVDAKLTAGPPATVASVVTVDRALPTVAALLVSPLSGTNLSGTSIRLHLTWTGVDTGGAGVARYEAQVSVNGGTTWANVSTNLPTPLANAIAASSGTVRYRVRAVDKAGNAGTYLMSPTESPRLIQQTTTGITYTTGWTTATSTSYSGGSVKYATLAGKSVTYKFTGRSIAFVTTRATSRGKVKVYLDGVLVTTLDLSGTTMYRYVAWQKTWSTVGTRTVRLVNVGTTGRPRIDLDAFAVAS